MTRALSPRPATPDKDLIALVANGNLEALGQLFDRYEADLRRFIGRLGVAAGDVDDLVQTAFLEVIRAAPRFDAGLPAKSWLFGLAVMLVRRHRRSLSRAAARLLQRASWPRPESPPTPAAVFDTDQDLQRFQLAFARMSAKKREVFSLVTLEGLSGEEAARTLGIPVATVRTRLHHARQELRASLGELKP
jgi:RNA polymerase sigma-70 factor (ECF subfamily)